MKKALLIILLVLVFPIGGEEKKEPVYNVYFGDLHNHSRMSDGKGTPLEAYTYARDNANFDFFSLADHAESLEVHDWGEIQVAAHKTYKEGKFVTFWGFEWSEPHWGHVTVINAATWKDSIGMTFSDLLEWVNARDCVAFFNHPGRQDGMKCEFNHFKDPPSDKFVGMEPWNCSDGFDKYYYTDGYFKDDGGKSWIDEANARGWRVGASGAGDNHRATWGRNKPYRMAILAEKLTRDDLYEALKERRFYSTLDLNLRLWFKCGGKEMGAVHKPGTYNLDISMVDNSHELFTKVELKKNGAVVKTWKPNRIKPKISCEIQAEKNDFYYVIVTQQDGDQAISSPHFFRE